MPTFDSASSAQTSATVTSISVSHSASGSDRLALICASHWQQDPAASDPVTYGGSSAGVTLVRSETQDAVNNRRKAHLYRLIAPPTGAQTAQFNLASPTFDVALSVVSYTGVDQTDPLGTAAGVTGSSAAPSVNVSSASGELVVDYVRAFAGVTSLTANASQTSRVEQEGWSANGPAAGNSEKAGAASVTMSWTLSASSPWAHIAVPLKPAAGGGGQIVEVGINTETDSAFALTFSKAKAVGLNTEIDSALSATAAKRMSVGQATEADSALTLTFGKTKIVGLAIEVDSALSLDSGQIVTTVARVLRRAALFGRALLRRG